MSALQDLLAVQAALSGEGDLDRAIDVVLGLPAELQAASQLAAQLMIVLMKNGAAGDVERLSRIEALLNVAERFPPADPNWPRMRTAARSYALLAACFEGRLADSAVDTGFQKLIDEAGDDPHLRQLVEFCLRMSSHLRSARAGDMSFYGRMQDDIARMQEIAKGNPAAAPNLEVMDRAARIMTRLHQGGRPEDLAREYEEIARALPDGSPLRPMLDEAVTTARILSGTHEADGASGESGLDVLERTLHEPGITDAQRVMRHLVAGGAALNQGDEKDVDRVSTGIGHFRSALALSAAQDPLRPFHLCSLALGLLRRNALTNRVDDLESAVAALHEARELAAQAGGPRHPHWSLINQLLAGASTRRGEPDAANAAVDGLRNNLWRILLDDDPGSARHVARDAADTALEAARQCLITGSVDNAVRALEGGRGLMLFAATELRAVDARLAASGREDLADRWRRIRDTPKDTAQYTELRREVLAAVTDDSDLLDPPGTREIARALRVLDADALVYLMPSASGVPGYAVTVSADGSTGYVGLPNLTLDPEFDIEAAVAGLSKPRDLSPRTSGPAAPGAATDLCDWAWRAAVGPLVAHYLPTLPKPGTGRPPRLILVPTGVLALVPWQAARRSDGDFALRYVALSQAASARMLCRSAAQAPVAPTPVGLVVGDPDTGDPADDLPAARIEASAVHQAYYRGGRYLGRRANGSPSASGAGTVEEVRDWLTTERPGAGTMVHLACHGVSGAGTENGEKPASYLVLAGGKELAAGQIIDVMGSAPQRAVGLAVLAACRTAHSIYGYDEAYSLGTAFLAGGVRSVLSTLWRVPDVSTSVLMFMFHHYLQVEHRPPWAALWRAQLWMTDPDREVPAEMPPRLRQHANDPEAARIDAWAAFVHWGQ